jgi:hypothetical protein
MIALLHMRVVARARLRYRHVAVSYPIGAGEPDQDPLTAPRVEFATGPPI